MRKSIQNKSVGVLSIIFGISAAIIIFRGNGNWSFTIDGSSFTKEVVHVYFFTKYWPVIVVGSFSLFFIIGGIVLLIYSNYPAPVFNFTKKEFYKGAIFIYLAFLPAALSFISVTLQFGTTYGRVVVFIGVIIYFFKILRYVGKYIDEP